MYFLARPPSYDVRVQLDGTTTLDTRGGDFTSAKSVSIDSTQLRIMSVLVRATAPVAIEELAQRTLPIEELEDDRKDRIGRIREYLLDLLNALSVPGLIYVSDSVCCLAEPVHRVGESDDWHLLQSIPEREGQEQLLKPVLVQTSWILPGATESEAVLDIHEIVATRRDGEMRLLGYGSGPFDTDNLPYFTQQFRSPDSDIIRWAGVRDPKRVELHLVNDTGEILYAEKDPGEMLQDHHIRMAVGPSGAEGRLMWNRSGENGISTPEARTGKTPIKFRCGNSTYTTVDGRIIEKQVPGCSPQTLKLGRRAARFLMHFLSRSPVGGPVSENELLRAVWSDRNETETNPGLVRRMLHHVRSVFQPDDLILSVGSGRYALHAELSLWFRDDAGSENLPAGLEQVPLRFLFPHDFIGTGPARGDVLEFYDIRAARDNGQSPMLGFAAGTGLTEIKRIFDPRDRYGQHLLEWAQLDCSRLRYAPIPAPDSGISDGSGWRADDGKNYIVIFPNATVRWEWRKPRLGAQGSGVEAVQQSARERLAAEAEDLGRLASDVLCHVSGPVEGISAGGIPFIRI